tara:strand:+ start:3609 stop:4085 length:477 start_codon:yes stop_codon:yes gene_type:complete
MNYEKSYKPSLEWEWVSYSGDPIKAKDFIDKYKVGEIYVGTDSQVYGVHIVFTTVIVIHLEGNKGGICIRHTEKIRSKMELRERLTTETMRSIEACWFLSELVPRERIHEVHLDVNKDKRYNSGKYHDELVGMVSGQGFNAKSKPDAWASTCIADAKC